MQILGYDDTHKKSSHRYNSRIRLLAEAEASHGLVVPPVRPSSSHPECLIGIGRGLAVSPSHTTGHTGHVSGGSAESIRVIRHPNWSVVSQRASREFLPGARTDQTPRRMPSHRSTPGSYPSPPFGPSAYPRCGLAYPLPRLSALECLTSFACAEPTMPSADFCGVVREDCSSLSPIKDTPQISRGKLSYRPCIDARFIKHRPIVNGGLCCRVPARPDGTPPHIGFVSLAPPVRSTLPSDPPHGDALALPLSFGSTYTWTGDFHPQA